MLILAKKEIKEEYEVIKHKVKVFDENNKPKKKEDGHYLWEEKEVRYRIDSDFIPETIGQISESFIQNYCEANHEEDWLTNQYLSKETVKKKDGKEVVQDKSFVSIKSDFVKKFFPDILKKKNNVISRRTQWLEKHNK